MNSNPNGRLRIELNYHPIYGSSIAMQKSATPKMVMTKKLLILFIAICLKSMRL